MGRPLLEAATHSAERADVLCGCAPRPSLPVLAHLLKAWLRHRRETASATACAWTTTEKQGRRTRSVRCVL